ncbi:hypothetical protein T4D_13904 [Trichinella pseudospiralis]|uniref:Uncharacterized protein n=1 Tax=Trichinella pseudospiralis TaxID=6337 RepID=A0A0V1FWQ2_TRIPS|nr:hypothetical protein T4D_13904 [Trichinella pseudospiralis]
MDTVSMIAIKLSIIASMAIISVLVDMALLWTVLTLQPHPVLLKLGKTCPLHLISLTLETCPISKLVVF